MLRVILDTVEPPSEAAERRMEYLSRMTVERGCTEAEAAMARRLLAGLRQRWAGGDVLTIRCGECGYNAEIPTDWDRDWEGVCSSCRLNDAVRRVIYARAHPPKPRPNDIVCPFCPGPRYCNYRCWHADRPPKQEDFKYEKKR